MLLDALNLTDHVRNWNFHWRVLLYLIRDCNHLVSSLDHLAELTLLKLDLQQLLEVEAIGGVTVNVDVLSVLHLAIRLEEVVHYFLCLGVLFSRVEHLQVDFVNYHLVIRLLLAVKNLLGQLVAFFRVFVALIHDALAVTLCNMRWR